MISRDRGQILSNGSDVRVCDNVVARRVDDEVVVVDLATNRIFSLNPTGARFWELLADGLSRSAIRARMLEEFDVDAGVLDDEIERLVRELNAESLVEYHGD